MEPTDLELEDYNYFDAQRVDFDFWDDFQEQLLGKFRDLSLDGWLAWVAPPLTDKAFIRRELDRNQNYRPERAGWRFVKVYKRHPRGEAPHHRYYTEVSLHGQRDGREWVISTKALRSDAKPERIIQEVDKLILADVQRSYAAQIRKAQEVIESLTKLRDDVAEIRNDAIYWARYHEVTSSAIEEAAGMSRSGVQNAREDGPKSNQYWPSSNGRPEAALESITAWVDYYQKEVRTRNPFLH